MTATPAANIAAAGWALPDGALAIRKPPTIRETKNA
jgi:hypothetical protein